ncbi:hypothetical protein [Cupriavidus sp. amp6]|uniref:hypothetical protein n=1 Tax=Cupriavidus sp. amp6 TaxID=388051 RepID=UPI0012EC5454|nr:hypothetical protein [Cupriavidus sp. amp6]
MLRTLVVVAHRLSTLLHGQLIYEAQLGNGNSNQVNRNTFLRQSMEPVSVWRAALTYQAPSDNEKPSAWGSEGIIRLLCISSFRDAESAGI